MVSGRSSTLRCDLLGANPSLIYAVTLVPHLTSLYACDEKQVLLYRAADEIQNKIRRKDTEMSGGSRNGARTIDIYI